MRRIVTPRPTLNVRPILSFTPPRRPSRLSLFTPPPRPSFVQPISPVVVKSLPSEYLLRSAAARINAREPYKKVLTEMGLNLDSHGKYLGCTGEDYKLVQRALRTLRRQTKKRLLHEVAQPNNRAHTKTMEHQQVRKYKHILQHTNAY